MDTEKLKSYYELINDIWKFLKAHADPDDTDEYWDDFAECTRLIHEKYHKSQISHDLLLAVVNEIERIHKERSNG